MDLSTPSVKSVSLKRFESQFVQIYLTRTTPPRLCRLFLRRGFTAACADRGLVFRMINLILKPWLPQFTKMWCTSGRTLTGCCFAVWSMLNSSKTSSQDSSRCILQKIDAQNRSRIRAVAVRSRQMTVEVGQAVLCSPSWTCTTMQSLCLGEHEMVNSLHCLRIIQLAQSHITGIKMSDEKRTAVLKGHGGPSISSAPFYKQH